MGKNFVVRQGTQKQAIMLAIINYSLTDHTEKARLRELVIRGVTEDKIIERLGGTRDQMPGEDCFAIGNSQGECLKEISRVSCYLYPSGDTMFYEIRVGKKNTRENTFSGECADQRTCTSMHRLHTRRMRS